MTETTKVYTCQSCDHTSTIKEEFKILVMLGIGFVTCKSCLKGWSDD